MKKILSIIIVISIVVIYTTIKNKKEVSVEKEISFEEKMRDIIVDNIDITKYYIYGNHLNIEGKIPEELNEKNTKLVLKSEKKELEYDVHILDSTFSTSNLLNEGINLETIKEGKYYILLKIIQDENTKYYGCIDQSNMIDNIYYTLSNNNKTNKVEIKSDEYMYLNIKNKKIPKNVYDIVLDAGHGGKDSGAIYNKNKESTFTLDYTLSLKQKLENYGYKVKVTRDKDITLNSYGKNSRTSTSYETKAKYLFSIHFNENKVKWNGIEFYAAPNINLDFISSLANDVVNNVGIGYAKNTYYKVKDGIYVRTFNSYDINKMNEDATKKGYTPYEIKENTPYLYMIRETGGFMTKAMIDGREANKGKNEYYQNNIASESYLLELSYMNTNDCINFIVNNKEKYTDVLANSIHHYIETNVKEKNSLN